MFARERMNEISRNYRKRLRENAISVTGNVCYFCNRVNNNCYHRKDGKQHSRSTMMYRLVIAEPSEWVRLCYPCHKAVHWVMTNFGMTWDEIDNKFKKKIVVY